jgi:serine/threonine protein kinase
VHAVRFLQWNAVLHRDIKPTNVLFQYQGRNQLLCKLIDFGSCFILRKESQHLFNPKVFTTPTFNLTYREAIKRSNHTINHLFTQSEYETHELFDICGIAKTVAFLVNNSPHRSQLL